jgi:hypothetical protein
MAVSATGIPAAEGWPNEDIFLATIEELSNDMVTSELVINHPLYYWYKENKLIEMRSDVSTHISVRLRARENSTVKDFGAYEDLDLTPQDVLDEGKFTYGYTAGTQIYSFQEVNAASSKSAIIDLVSQKQEQLLETMTNHFGATIIGSQNGDGKTMMGFGRIMAYNQPCGNIDPTVPGFEYWNPQRGLKSGGAQYSLATEFRAGMRKLTRECTYNFETPNLWLMGEDVYDAQEAFVEDKVRITPASGMRDQKVWNDFEAFMDQKNRVYIFDKSLDPKTAWLINTKRTKIRVQSSTYFKFEPWKTIQGKVAKYRECLLVAATYTTRRNTNGTITFT